MKDDRIKYLSQNQVRDFLGVITEVRDRAMFLLAYHYALRAGEIPLLRRDHVDFKTNRIFIPRLKRGIANEKPLLPDVKKALKAYLDERTDPDPALFMGRKGPLGYRGIHYLFRGYAKAAGIPLGGRAKEERQFCPHSLRHAAAVHAIETEGIDLVFLKDFLGHVNIQNTLIYASVSDNHRNAGFKLLQRSSKVVKG